MRRIVLLLTLIAFTMTSFLDDADARRRRRRSRTKRAPIINEKKLYERIGGPKRMGEIVDEWVRLNLADARIAPAFAIFTAKPDKLTRERRGLTDHLCELADGPCKTKDAEELKLNEMQFLVFGDNLFKSMQKHEVPEREKNELLARLGETKGDFVESAKTQDQSENQSSKGE